MKDSIADNIHHLGFKRLLLAVSGGLDSICLAHYFIANREALGIEWLGIAHVHHGLREGTADRDAAFVEAFAKAHGVPFFLKRLDGESLKNAEGSLEENARDARYKALIEVFNETGDPPHTGTMRTKQQVAKCCPPVLRGDDNKGIIVTAHHAGDQAETMYMRLRRGTTLAGLRGIQEIRILSNSQSVASPTQEDTSYCLLSTSYYIFRPFLSVTRADLLAYAREHNLTWCEDESNSDTKFARNFIRHEALPHLERNCPGATRQLCRIAGLADKAYGMVMEKCNELFNPIVSLEKEMPGQAGHDNATALTPHSPNLKAAEGCDPIPHTSISLNKKALRKIFLAHSNADLSEMFRLWLSEQGFRFPIGFFYSQTEPAHVKIPVRAAYRKRAIAKNGSTVRICEFESVEAALKFVSCK